MKNCLAVIAAGVLFCGVMTGCQKKKPDYEFEGSISRAVLGNVSEL